MRCTYFRMFKSLLNKLIHKRTMEKSMNPIKDSSNQTIVHEGKAKILVAEKNVFYNPVQEFNRDLSVAVLSLFSQNKYNERVAKQMDKSSNKTSADSQDSARGSGISILEALSATGLRSIRYGKEIPYVERIVANDISSKAVDCIKKNIEYNGMDHLINANHQDATMFMYQSRQNRFDVIDLDPYGCPSIFLDSAVQCVNNGGLLLVTATDMAVLAGNSPETCYVKYGAVSIKSKACHELALRILLQHIAAHAGRYGRYIEPLLSVSVDFYIRVFVRIFTGQIQCKMNTSKLGMVYQCVGCESMKLQPLGIYNFESYKLPPGPPVDQLCTHCRHKHHIGGPIWIGPIHNQSFVTELIDSVEDMELGTLKRIKGVLSVIHEELDIPLYYVLDRLMSIVRCDTPSMIKFRSALLNAGYRVSFSHTNKLSIKTDAPTTIIWDIVRAWEKVHPAKRDRMDINSPALAILTSNSTIDVTFHLHPSANPTSRKMHLSRFQINPTANWGPGSRSTTIIDPKEISSKKRKNQNKQRKKDIVKRDHVYPVIDATPINKNNSPPLKQFKTDCL